MPATIRAFLEADVTCYHCGAVSGVARKDKAAPNAPMTFLARGSEAEVPLTKRSMLRCARCSGPTFFDEFQSKQIVVTDGLFDDLPRRGRPPKRLVEQRRREAEALEARRRGAA
jgi:hypothetical protein